MKFNNRYLGVVIIVLFIIFVLFGGIFFKGFIFVLLIMVFWEFYKVLKEKDFKLILFVGYIFLIIYYILNNNFEMMMYIFVVVMFILLIYLVINLEYMFVDVVLILLGFIYVGILFSFVYLVNTKLLGNFLVWFIFIGLWFFDIVVYYSGKNFGKYKFFLKVFFKKIIEGFIGGLLGVIIFLGIFGIIINKYINIMFVYYYFIIGLLCGVFG